MGASRNAGAAKAWIIAAPIVALLGACTVSQAILIRADASGDAALSVEVDPTLASYVLELAAFGGTLLPETGLFDAEEIRSSLQSRPGVEVTVAESADAHQLTLEFVFADAESIFKSASLLWEAGVITFGRANGQSNLRLYMDRDNFKQLETLFPVLRDPFLRAMGPEENAETSADDYLTMLGFILGDSGPPAVVDSVIRIEVTVDGTLVSQVGGRRDGDRVVFEIPILDLLLLHQPIDLRVTFQ